MLDRSRYASAEGLRTRRLRARRPAEGDPEVILIATGSEVPSRVERPRGADRRRRRARVVSLPCWELFDRQDQDYRESVLPPAIAARVSIEQASTLGWDRYVGPAGRDDRHAHLRLLGAAEGRADASSASRPRRSPRPREELSAWSNEKPTQQAPRARPEPLARQHHPHDARRRHARALHRRALGHRPDLQPDDLRQGDQRRRRLRRADRASCTSRALERRGALLRAGARPTCTAPRSCSRRSTSAPTGSTAGSRSRSRRCSPTTPRRRSSRRRAPRAGRPRQHLHQDPGHAGRAARRSRSRSSPASRSTSRCCSRREQYLAAADAYMRGHRAPDRGGPRPGGPLGRLAVHQPLGRRGGREVPDELTEQLGDRGRQARLPRLPRAARLRRAGSGSQNEGARPQRLLWASTGTKDPEALRHALRRGPRRAATDQHDAREDAARLRRPRRGRRAAARRRRRRRGGAAGASPRPASTPTRSPRSSRRRAPRPSSSPGTTCSARSTPSASRLAASE